MPEPEPEPTAEPEEPECADTFDTTFAAVQEIVFEREGCTGCHNAQASGGLDLSEGLSWANLYEVPAAGSDLLLLAPGDEQRSYLWNKLAAWTDDSLLISGGKMPPAGAISEPALELIRLWINAGAPEEGVLEETEDIIDACLPDPVPFQSKPLDPPAAGEGIQLVMPGFPLPAASEIEVCFATYVDVCDQIPEEYKTPDGNFFAWDTYEIRQNVGSHHLLIQAPNRTLGGQYVDPNDLDGWACTGGANEGATCDPLDADACGDDGQCATPVEGSTACIGYEAGNGISSSSFSGTQQPQLRVETHPGVYQNAPCRTVVFWNSHSFNLTTTDTIMRARLNYEFADDRRFRSRSINSGGGFGITRLMAQGTAPYSKAEMCSDVALPVGAHLTGMSSHTHKRGERSWWTDPAGELIYENLIYNDPPRTVFAEPRVYDSTNAADRTFRFCTIYNNGIDEAGNPDSETVTRSSRIPYGFGGPGNVGFGSCEPEACVNPGADLTINCDDGAANRTGDDAACDTSPGAGDGYCDACQIMGGLTTENEMFQGTLQYFLMD